MLNCTSELKVSTRLSDSFYNFTVNSQYLIEQLQAHGTIKATWGEEENIKYYTFVPFHAVELAFPHRSCEEVEDPVDEVCEESSGSI